ncbi:MAG: hypothetical protein U9Q88_06405 [Bacillota bacterium]|nr:hypothetical protein [Bacillota bacterium]
MKRYLIVLFIFILVIFVGCSSNISGDENLAEETYAKSGESNEDTTKGNDQKQVNVEKRTEAGYITINVLETREEIEKLESFFEDKQWAEDMEVQMATPPEYRFTLNGSIFAVWITPLGDELELIREGEAVYIKLGNQHSSILFELLTGEVFISE